MKKNKLETVFSSIKDSFKAYLCMIEADLQEVNELVSNLSIYKPFELDIRSSSPIQNALNIAVIISYSRNFKRSLGFADVSQINRILISRFNRKELKLHQSVLEKRDKEFAHSDASSVDIQLYENGIFSHSSKVVRQLLDKHELRTLTAMIIKIRSQIALLEKDLKNISICRLTSGSS